MSNVIQVQFGTERWFKELEQSMLARMLLIGTRCGDDEAVLRLKVERAMRLMREMCGPFPVSVENQLPEDLTEQQKQLIDAAIQNALSTGKERAREFCVTAVHNALHELCTSALLYK